MEVVMKSLVASALAASILAAGAPAQAGEELLAGSYLQAAAALRQPGGSAPAPAVGRAGPTSGEDGIWISAAGSEDKGTKGPKDGPTGSLEDQLRWWDNNHSRGTAFFYSWFSAPNLVSSADIDAAAASYNRYMGELGGQASPEQKVQLLMRAVEDRFGDTGKVCRHYAALFYYTARRVGLSDVELRQHNTRWSTADDAGHCWNRITIDGQRFVVSPNWGTYYKD
jgi:hypothetical protein